MLAAKEGRFRLRYLTGLIILALAYVLAVALYKNRELQKFSDRQNQVLATRDAGFRNLFQAGFYFYFDEQFVPGVKQQLEEFPELKRVQFVSSDGQLLYDSRQPEKKQDGKEKISSDITRVLGQSASTVRQGAFSVQVIMPAGAFGVIYVFESAALKRSVLILLGLGALLFALAWVAYRQKRTRHWLFRFLAKRRNLLGLRPKFILTTILVNSITAMIVFMTLSELQTREQTQRIEKESVLFSQFSTGKVVSDFSNYFYFYYQDRFIPAVRTLIATNENLVGVRIVSSRTRAILFDSEAGYSGPIPEQKEDAPKLNLAEDQESILRARGLLARPIEREHQKLFSVISVFQNENQEPLFLIEYLFSYQSLTRSIATIKKQIMQDLIPSMSIGFLIAVLFAQLLINPIRKIGTALRKITEGDYNVTIDVERSDEIGDLVTSFNSMAFELQKKKELRKYLSGSTYRQIMEAPISADGTRLAGSRVSATILFSDIRDFVRHCESLEAEEVTSMLNDYFSEMVEVVHKHGGEVDKFIGDALLAVFYEPDEDKKIKRSESPGESSSSTALQAIYCALEMREKLVEFNKRRVALNKITIETGIGITHGEVISGPIGSKDRMDFTVIGDEVNLASRIEKISKSGKHTRIVFSNVVETKVRGLLIYEQLDHEPIQGIEGNVAVFELVRIRELRALAQNLKSPDSDLRQRSVELLGYSQNRLAIESLIDALKDPVDGVRIQAGIALSRLAERNEPVALDAVFAALNQEKSPKVISALVMAIGRFCASDRILELEPFLNSPDERIVANVVEAMGHVKNPRCNDLILAKVSSRNNRVKANAAMALFAAGHIEVIDLLKPMLLHSDPLMRSSAAFAIGELTLLAHKENLIEEWKKKGRDVNYFLAELQESVPMLVTLLRDPETIVKRQAIMALGKIKDRSTVLPIIGMIDIDTDSKEMIREISQALWSIGSHKMIREVLSRMS